MNSIEYYNQNWQTYYDRTLGIDMTDKYEKFILLLPQVAKILDAGCGVGRDAKYFAENGHKVTAFDGSAEMVRLSSALLNQPTRLLTFQDMDYEREFDAVWAAASLLHIPYEEMRGVFEKIHRSLTSSGIFSASFKYGDRKRFVDTRIFYDMNEQMLQPFLKGLFEVINLFTTSDGGIARNSSNMWLNFVCRKIA